MAFVEQQDALIGSLTVRETLRYAADLALSTSTTRAERKVRIDTLLRAFGLSDQSHSCIGTPITKGISGGQKRRVSVASQLITEPKVLFLDEPTSGLDFAAASEVMKYLRAMAETYQVSHSRCHEEAAAHSQLAHRHRFIASAEHYYTRDVRPTTPPFAGSDRVSWTTERSAGLLRSMWTTDPTPHEPGGVRTRFCRRRFPRRP